MTVREWDPLATEEPAGRRGVNHEGNGEIRWAYRIELIKARVKLLQRRTGPFKSRFCQCVISPMEFEDNTVANVGVELVWLKHGFAIASNVNSVNNGSLCLLLRPVCCNGDGLVNTAAALALLM